MAQWLIPLPEGDWDDWGQTVVEWMAADPMAAAIPTEEAELFLCADYIVRGMHPMLSAKLCRALGVPVFRNRKAQRKTALMIMRKWRIPRHRDLLVGLIPNCGFSKYPDPATGRKAWTEELFREAYEEGYSLVWLAQVRRHLGLDENLPEWFAQLGPEAEGRYQTWLNMGRLALRRLIYPEAPAMSALAEVAAAAQPELEQELRQKDRKSGSLRQGVRRLEQDRKLLKQQARRVELDARAHLAQARGEVQAARRALKEQLAAQERELARQRSMHEAQVRGLRDQSAAAQADFHRKLQRLPALNLLQGRSITVAGHQVQQTIFRQMVESLGGSYAPEGGETVLQGDRGLAALERELHSLALSQVLIRCDGLYRRRKERHGIAMAGFQVELGPQTVAQESRVVCCGPSAGSLMAEYGAVAMALRWMLKHEPKAGSHLEIWSDCKTLLSRLARRRTTRRKQGCIMLDEAIHRLTQALRKRGCTVQFRWVPREQVHAVDRLCARSYYDQTWYHRPRRDRPSAPLKEFVRRALRV